METLLKYFAKNKILVNIMIIIIIILGAIGIMNIKQDLFPQATLDSMIVSFVYPGAAPIDVEKNAIIPIERKLKTISGIKKYTSMSMENQGRIIITIDEDGNDVKDVKAEITRELQSIPDLAEDIDHINIIDANPDKMPVYELGVYIQDGAGISEKELYNFVDTLERKLLKVDGVSDVSDEGYREKEIKINVSPDKMAKYYISLNEIVNSIQKRNVRVTGGTLQSVNEDKSIVTIGQFEKPIEVGEVIIRSNFDGERVLVKDIADIEEGFKKSSIDVKVDGRKGVSVSIKKKPSSDVVSTVKNIKKMLSAEKINIPAGIEIARISDSSLSIISLLDITINNAFIGFIIVFLILLLFLQDIGTAFWTAFGIPITLLITIAYMNITHQTLNMLTLGAMVTVMGMLVDNGIVIAETIFEKRSKGIGGLDASVHGIKEVLSPITFGVITTVVAFIPMVFIKGIMGKFIRVFPIVIIVALIASLFEASILLPNHLAHMKVSTKKKKDWFEPIAMLYEKGLKKLLTLRYPVVLFFIILFGITIFISKDTVKDFVMMEDDSADQINIVLEVPKGINLAKTGNFTNEIEKAINNIVYHNELISVKTTIGHHSSGGMSQGGYHENWAIIGINLVPLSERKRYATEIVEQLRNDINIEKMPHFTKIVINKIAKGPPTGSEVEVKIIGDDYNKIDEIKVKIKNELASISGIINIEDSAFNGKDELVLVLNYDRIAQLDLNVASIASTIRTAYDGTVATYIQTSDNKLDFRVKIKDDYQKDMTFLYNLLISNNQGRLIRLKDVAHFKSSESKATIDHYDGDRVVSVTAGIKSDSDLTSSKVMLQLKPYLKTLKNEYNDIDLLFEGEASETKSAMGDLLLAFAIAVLMIYLVLILLFKNLSQPFIVMLTIPFGIIGALLAFVAHGMSLSFMGVIGIIGLSGVVVNASIVMVDFINKVVEENPGADSKLLKEFIASGAKQRLRPVILTTLTTVAGLLPTAYGIGGRSDMLIPIVIAMAYGLLFATFLTLIFIPALYMIRLDLIKLENFIKGLFIKRKIA
ncbi:MAG: hypothetical protein A2355_10495 [Spirochaetes bacterium RIFOXYB1_FULL_32_8]|nr:MAG: hypothetical protein A2355_10495 [Spirochaetes bacterium RIFOXYB1_FULL_32_8]